MGLDRMLSSSSLAQKQQPLATLPVRTSKARILGGIEGDIISYCRPILQAREKKGS